MIGVRPVLLPLDEEDLWDEEHGEQDQDHLCVHVRVARVLLVHPEAGVLVRKLSQLTPLS
jgi:hypothetical protein